MSRLALHTCIAVYSFIPPGQVMGHRSKGAVLNCTAYMDPWILPRGAFRAWCRWRIAGLCFHGGQSASILRCAINEPIKTWVIPIRGNLIRPPRGSAVEPKRSVSALTRVGPRASIRTGQTSRVMLKYYIWPPHILYVYFSSVSFVELTSFKTPSFWVSKFMLDFGEIWFNSHFLFIPFSSFLEAFNQ